MRRRGCTAAILLLTLAASGALADEAGERLVGDVIASIDRTADWKASASGLSSDGSQVIVDSLKISREDGSLSAEIGRLTLDSPALRPEGNVFLDAFVATNLTIRGAGWNLSAPEATARTLETPSFAGWSFDPLYPLQSVATLYTRLAQSRLMQLGMPSATVTQSLDVPGIESVPSITTSYHDIRLGPLTAGILASQSIARIEQRTSVGGKPVTSTIEALEIRGADLAALAHVFDPAAYENGKGDETWRPALEGATYGSVTIRDGEREVFAMGPVTLGTLEVRQTPEPFVPALDRLIAMGNPPSQQVQAFFEQQASNLVGWLRLRTLDFSDLRGSSVDGSRFSLDRIAFAGLSADGLTQFSLRGAALEGPQFTATLSLLELGNIVWPSLKSFVALGRLEESKKAGKPDPALFAAAADAMLDVLPRVGRFSIHGLSAGVPGSEPLTLDSYEATISGRLALLPQEASAQLKSLVIPQAILHATPESRSIFDALGYASLTAHLDGQATYEEELGRYRSASVFTVDDAGSLMLGYSLSALTIDRLVKFLTASLASGDGEPSPQEFQAALGPVAIDSMTLRFEDASLIRRLISYFAAQQNMDEATLIGNAGAFLQLGLSQLRNPDFTASTVAAVTEFLNNPRSITLSVKPEQPVELNSLMALDPANPGAAIGLLGVTVRANE